MSLPTNHSYEAWQNAGAPIPVTTPILVDTYAVTYCKNDGTVAVMDVELHITELNEFSFVENGESITSIYHVLRVTPLSTPDNLARLNIRRIVRAGQDPTLLDFKTDNNLYDVFTWNSTNTALFTNWLELRRTYNIAGTLPAPLQNFEASYFGEPFNFDFCGSNPTGCTLAITGSSVTAVTSTNAGDGQIAINISGGTGGTYTYYLNNSSPQTSNLFTGLDGGIYTAIVTQGDCIAFEDNIIVPEGSFVSSDFIVNEPNNFIASENPIITRIGTAFNGGETFATTKFTVSDDIVNNDSVTISLSQPINYSKTFIARDFPDGDNFFLTPVLKNRNGEQVGTNSNNQIAASLADAIADDIIFRNLYYIDVDGDEITLKAKQADENLTLDVTNVTLTLNTSDSILIDTILRGKNRWEGSIVTNYSLYADVYVGQQGSQYGEPLSSIDYDNVVTLELPFSSDNVHDFDVSDVMKTFVNTPRIDLTFTGFTFITEMIRPFYIKYGEAFPLVPNENTIKRRPKGQTGYKWVLNSSLDFEDVNDLTDYFVNANFLTNSPTPLKVQRNQTNFLYLILPKDLGTELKCKGDIEYYDGTSQTGVTFFDIAVGQGAVVSNPQDRVPSSNEVTNAGGVYALNTSYDALKLADFEASGNTKVKRVTIGVYSDDTLYSEEKTYQFEIDEQPRRFGLAFLNKLGGYDTFDFVGVVENSVVRENQTYTVPRRIGVQGNSPQGFKSTAMYDTKVTKTITVNTGWIDSDHFDWLIELLSSNDIYSYTEEDQNYLILESYDYVKSSLEDLFDIEIQFRQTLYENNISV